MSLLTAVLKWLGTKALQLSILVCILLLLLYAKVLAWPWISEQCGLLDEKPKILSSIQDLERDLNQKNLEISNWRDSRPERPPIYKPLARRRWELEDEAVRALYDQKATLESKLSQRRLELSTIEGTINPKFEAVWYCTKAHFFRILTYAICLVIMPYAWKVIWYFGLLRLLDKATPIGFGHGNGKPIGLGRVQKNLQLTLQPRDCVLVRADHIQQYDTFLRKSTRVLWSWRAPFLSFMSGLKWLTEVENCSEEASQRNGKIDIGSPSGAEVYFAEINLKDGDTLVVLPKHIVALTAGMRPSCRWHLWNWHAWAMGQLRFVLLHGPGRVYLSGCGGLVEGGSFGRSERVAADLIVAWDSRAAVSAARTETFVPYWRGQTASIDRAFCGKQFFLRQTNRSIPSARDPFERTWNLIFGTIEKAVGV